MSCSFNFMGELCRTLAFARDTVRILGALSQLLLAKLQMSWLSINYLIPTKAHSGDNNVVIVHFQNKSVPLTNFQKPYQRLQVFCNNNNYTWQSPQLFKERQSRCHRLLDTLINSNQTTSVVCYVKKSYLSPDQFKIKNFFFGQLLFTLYTLGFYFLDTVGPPRSYEWQNVSFLALFENPILERTSMCHHEKKFPGFLSHSFIFGFLYIYRCQEKWGGESMLNF